MPKRCWVQAVRFNCTRAITAVDDAHGVTLASFSLHTVTAPESFVSLRSYWSNKVCMP